MAVASIDTKKLEKMLKCSICHEILSDPKTLSCFHSFCDKCVKQLERVKQKEDTGVKCPACRAFTSEKALKGSFLVHELLEIHKSKQSGLENVCENCLENQPQWKCLDCKIILCKKCQGNHHRVPLLRGHRVLTLDDETESVIDRLVFCTKHADQPIIFNCRNCEVPLCIKCKVTQHESHKTETIEDTLERILPEVDTCVDEVKGQITDIGDNSEHIKTKMNDIREQFSQCRKKNTDNLEKIMQKAKKQHKQLEKVLDMKEQEELDKLESWLNRKKEYEQLLKWVCTCNQTAKGVSMMWEMQTGLFEKLKRIWSSKKLSETRLALDIPKLNGNDAQDEMENMTGQLTYKASKVFNSIVVDGRAPPVLYTDIFSKQLVNQKEIHLKGRCTRISIIDGDIWAPIPTLNIIQVFDLDGNELPSVQCNSGPRSVKQQEDGDILLASDSGIFTINSDGTHGPQLQGTTGAFSDFSICGETMTAVNYNQRQTVYFSRTEGTWSQQGALPLQYSTNHAEDTVLMNKEIFLTHRNTSYNTITKYNNQHKYIGYYRSTQQAMCYLYLVGSDTAGNILIADSYYSRLQLYNPNTNQWQLVSNTLVPHGSQPLDVLYDNEGSVWVLSSDPQDRLVKYRQQDK